MKQLICRVHILDLPFHADRPFDYFVPQTVKEVHIGNFVAVPFGGANRTQVAAVTEIREAVDAELSKLKPLHAVIYPDFSLDEDDMALVRFLCSRTLCSYGDAIKAVCPVSSFSQVTENYSVAPSLSLSEREQGGEILEFIEKKGSCDRKKLLGHFGTGAQTRLRELERSGIIVRGFRLTESKENCVETVYLTGDAERLLDSPACRRSKKKREAVELLSEGELTFEELKIRCALTRAQLNAMCSAGLVRVEKTDKYRTPYTSEHEALRPALSDEQRKASDTLCGLFDRGRAQAALLYGVTGSGKTQVMRELIDHVTERGRSVIMLVPEIALTPQTVGFFISLYGQRVVVIHSALSAGERFDAWRKIRDGLADICIGTRSAVFAPFKNLGAIIIDEEQEHTYKSDRDPKYHAVDVARLRCARSDALMLLASATPSVEGFYKAETGKYTLVRLTERYGEAHLPEVIIADMREDARAGNTSPIGSVLSGELKKNLESKDKTILFVNRRGYNSFLSCNMCGNVCTCPHCSVSLTYHTRGRYISDDDESIGDARARNGYLVCHYCGYRIPVPHACSECGNKVLQFMGFGTQLAENRLLDGYDGIRVLRMDADTTRGKFSHDKILDKFRSGEADVLLGTQMVTKGHDFPDVTLVGVLNADSSLFLDDFRANERTFSLITQVIGRAGRGDKAGRAVIQTYSPDSPVLKKAAEQDYDGFYKDEIALRRALVFPPFCDIALFSFSCPSEDELAPAAKSFADRMRELLTDKRFKDVRLQAFGPFEAPIYKKRDRYYMRLVVKCVSNTDTRSLFALLIREQSAKNRRIGISCDINPSVL